VDVDGLKARFAVAFAESMFRRAGHQVARAAWKDRDPGPVRHDLAVITPDLLLWRNFGRHPRRLLEIVVKYRPGIPQDETDALAECVRVRWPALNCVIVTDATVGGRSCFQAFRSEDSPEGGGRCELVDLHRVRELALPATTVATYEGLVQGIFGWLDRRPAHMPEPDAPASREGEPVDAGRDHLVKMLQYQVRSSSRLPVAMRVELRAALESLKRNDSDDPPALAAWQFLREAAPEIWHEGRQIRDVLMGERVKKALGLA
jgi:hypothetical protein